jgi:hypothetical protein
MRKILVLAAAIAAASCGGNQGNVSHEEAQSIGEAMASAISAAGPRSEGNYLTFGTGVRSCPGGGDISASGSLTVSCPSGFFSCTYTSISTLTADQCVTAAGVTIDGSLTTTVTGKGLSFTVTSTGELTITRPDGTTVVCTSPSLIVVGGKVVGGNVCGVRL